jgi:hypothetical protein
MTNCALMVEPSHPDAVLIRTCHRFAEARYEDWYRYLTAPDGQCDEDSKPDFDTLNWIAETPASTPEGCAAKALVCACWNHDMYDDPEDDRDSGSPILAALLREMAGPARNAILMKLEERFGPLPGNYTPDWRWIGPKE